jgi:type II secretory pathway predicted ATPase ExeA
VFARPTADQIWLGPAQEAALSQLSSTTRTRLLVGPPSSGKTTLLNHIAARLAAESTVLQCRGPKEDATAVLASLLLTADLAPWELSEVEQRNLLTVFIHQRRSQGRRVIVVIDDAHALKPAAWEEIERLVAFRIDKRPAIELLIAGPRSLARRIDRERTGLEAQEVVVHALDQPSSEDLMKYVEWRLSRFEMADLFTSKANQMIARLSGGRYAAVDVLCQMSLLLMRQLDAERVDSRVAQQALATLVERQTTKLDTTAVLQAADRPVTVPPQGYLLISRAGKVLNRITLGQRTLLGRSEHNDVCLPSPYLGRHHAAIVGTPEGYYVIDLNSVNGLLVNGRQVERAILCDQDVLTIGPFRMKVQIPDWLAHGNPFPATDSLDDTAILPVREPPAPAAMRVVK